MLGLGLGAEVDNNGHTKLMWTNRPRLVLPFTSGSGDLATPTGAAAETAAWTIMLGPILGPILGAIGQLQGMGATFAGPNPTQAPPPGSTSFFRFTPL